MPCFIKGFFDIQEYRSCRHVIVEIKGHVVRKPHTLKRRAVTEGTETKLACIKQASFFNVPSDYFQNNFLDSLPVMGNRLIGGKF
jgi:hypothetical protein